MLKQLAVVFLLAAFSNAAAADYTDYTDMWWNPNESGWGANFTQNQDTIFATLFIYGSTGQPTWVSGAMTQVIAGQFSGRVIASTGPYFAGSVFNPAAVSRVDVGQMTFTANTDSTGQPVADAGVLSYTVGNLTVTKSIQRLPLTTVIVGGTYKGALLDSVTGCRTANQNSSASLFTNVNVTQAALAANGTSNMRIVLGIVQSDGTTSPTCTITGDATPLGQLFSIANASYTCTNGVSTTAAVSQLKASSLGVEGRVRPARSNGCIEDITFSAVHTQ